MKASDFFGPWEQEVYDYAGLLDAVKLVSARVGSHAKQTVWRGVVNAEFGLYSSLYRKLSDQKKASGQKQAFPTEKEMLAAEEKIIECARAEWRFADLTTLELLAHLQHYGGPTRLLDVTYNPLIAAWFAVEAGEKLDVVDARLFAFDVAGRELTLNSEWNSDTIPWKSHKQKLGWETKRASVWRPPNYNPRIPAQDAAFLLGGVPTPSRSEILYRKEPGDGTGADCWKRDEIRAAVSIPVAMNSLSRKPRNTPTYTLRIKACAKESIRNALENDFGYSSASLFPDLYGLSEALNKQKL